MSTLARPWIALWVALTCASCRSSRAPEALSLAPAPPPDLRVGSYNVLYELAEKKPGAPPAEWVDASTLQQAASLDVDVLLLQETNAAWEAALRPALAARFADCRFHDPVRWAPEGLAVCSKYPITVDRLVTAPGAMFPALHVRIATPLGDVDFLDVHLQPAIAGPADWMRTHLGTRARRKAEIEALLAEIPGAGPAIVAGDTNERPEGDLFAALTAAGFDNALPAMGVRAVTWRWYGADPPLEHQLDHVAFRRAAFEVVSAEVRRGGRSDHDAVVVVLRKR